MIPLQPLTEVVKCFGSIEVMTVTAHSFGFRVVAIEKNGTRHQAVCTPYGSTWRWRKESRSDKRKKQKVRMSNPFE